MAEKEKPKTDKPKTKGKRGQGSLFQPHGEGTNWWVQFYYHGLRQRLNTGTDNKRQAEKVLSDKIQEVSAGTFNDHAQKVTVAELVATKITKAKNDKHKSVADDESRWRLHLKPMFGSTLASRLTTPLLSKYVEKRLEAKAEAGTINRELSLLRGAFNLAHESTPRLVSQVPTFPMLKETNVRKGFLTDKQYDDLAAACLAEGVWLRAVFEVGCSYGWRREEVIGLRVRQVDVAGKCIRLEESKNGDQREVAIRNPTLLTLLETCITGKNPDDAVFTWPADHRFRGKPVKDFRDRWERVTKACGVPNLLFHDLRRTAARSLRKAGVPETVIMKIGGWRTPAVFKRYAIVDSQDMATAMDKLEASREEARAELKAKSQQTANKAPETGQSETRLN